MERVDCVVIGAGVIGLAIARQLALAGRDVILLEATDCIGSGTSSRNRSRISSKSAMVIPTQKSVPCIACR